MPAKFNVTSRTGVPFQTVDATPIVAAEFDASPFPLQAFWVDVKVLAAYADGSKAAAYWLQGCFRSNAAGTLTLVGSLASVVAAEEDTSGMDCTLSAIGTKVSVTATGVAATVINWSLEANIRRAPWNK